MTRIDSPAPPQANPAVRVARRRPGPHGFLLDSVQMAWRALRRMRTALWLLGVLGAETLVATVVPQQPNVARTVAAWRAGTEGPGSAEGLLSVPGDGVALLIDLVGAYDVYGSPLFLATLLLLFTSLTACLIPRVRAWWRVTTRSVPPRSAHLDDQRHQARLETSLDPDQALAAARGVLSGRRYRLRGDDLARDAAADPQVAAEKGLVVREGGSLVFHLSFYVLLVGIVLGQLLSFRGDVGIVEGQSFTDTAIGYWSASPGRWFGDDDHTGFQLTLDEFDVDWYRDGPNAGTPRLFSSDVSVTTGDGTQVVDTVGGNDPLVVDGRKVHQLDWGYAPRVVVRQDGQVVHDDFVELAVDSDAGLFAGAVKAPAAEPDIGFDVELFPTELTDADGDPLPTGAPWADAPVAYLQAWAGDLRLGETQQSTLELDTTLLRPGPLARVPVGETVDLGAGIEVEIPELRRWVGFQVSTTPTAPLLLLGAALVLAGLVPALYAYRRRVWVTATPADAPGRTLVHVAGRAFQRPQAFDDEFDDLVGQLARTLSARGVPAPDQRATQRVT